MEPFLTENLQARNATLHLRAFFDQTLARAAADTMVFLLRVTEAEGLLRWSEERWLGCHNPRFQHKRGSWDDIAYCLVSRMPFLFTNIVTLHMFEDLLSRFSHDAACGGGSGRPCVQGVRVLVDVILYTADIYQVPYYGRDLYLTFEGDQEMFLDEDVEREGEDSGIKSHHLKRVTYAELLEDGSSVFDEKLCAICLEQFDDNEGTGLAVTPCSHVFHDRCLALWLDKCDVCPMCRFEMPH